MFFWGPMRRIDDGNPADPVTVQDISMSLDIVLSSSKIPHEISQVHMAHLVSQKEFNIIQIARIVRIFDGSKLLVCLPVI